MKIKVDENKYVELEAFIAYNDIIEGNRTIESVPLELQEEVKYLIERG